VVSALIGGSAADDFLGAQGDMWDTQWDMFLALCGAILSQLLFSRVHDRQLARLIPGFKPPATPGEATLGR